MQSKSAQLPYWLKSKAVQRLSMLVAQARARMGMQFPEPTLSFDLRGTTAGTAHPGTHHIRLNAQLFAENVADFLEDTLPHELAHLLVYRKYGARAAPHGPQWKSVMKDVLGVEPSRCHQLDTSRSRVQRRDWLYSCGCPGHFFELGERHRANIRKGRTYSCKKCGQRLVFASRKPASNTTPPGISQIAYASLLAQKAGVALPEAARSSQEACKAFIDQHASLSPAGSAEPTPPTQKQLDYAQILSQRYARPIPEDALKCKKTMSDWISGLARG